MPAETDTRPMRVPVALREDGAVHYRDYRANTPPHTVRSLRQARRMTVDVMFAANPDVRGGVYRGWSGRIHGFRIRGQITRAKAAPAQSRSVDHERYDPANIEIRADEVVLPF
jgi:hypothetical protein